MNFDEAFNHYREGTATPEEIELVRDEIAKAKALSSLFDDEGLTVTPAPVSELDKEEVKKAKKVFRIKVLIAVVASIIVALLIVAAVLGGVFGSAATYANNQIIYTKNEGLEIAKNALVNNFFAGKGYDVNAEEIECVDVDKDFNYEVPIEESYYTYKYTFETEIGKYRVEIDTRDGEVLKINVKD